MNFLERNNSMETNPFSSGSDSLKNVINSVSEIIGGSPVLPDEYSSHVDSAVDDIANLKGPYLGDDVNKIIRKHFDTASEGNPNSTKLQGAFQKEVSKRMAQAQAKSRWEDH